MGFSIASIFVVAWFVLWDFGPPHSHQALAVETKGGDAKAENQSVRLNSSFGTSVLNVLLQVDGESLSTRFVRQGTSPVGTLIQLMGQNVECKSGTKELVEFYEDKHLGIKAKVVSKITNGMLTKVMIVQFKHKERSYTFEPKKTELASCNDVPGTTSHPQLGLYLLFEREHLLFDVTKDDAKDKPETVTKAPAKSPDLPTFTEDKVEEVQP